MVEHCLLHVVVLCTARNLQQNVRHISHHTLLTLLHFVKYKNQKIVGVEATGLMKLTWVSSDSEG